MSSLFDLLPAPKYTKVEEEEEEEEGDFVVPRKSRKRKTKKVPSYLNRGGWAPKTPEDFEDGGAYPEIHLAQFPFKVNMGLGGVGDGGNIGIHQSTALLPYSVDTSGEQDLSSLVREGHRKNQIIYSSVLDVLGTNENVDLSKPKEEEKRKIAEQTRNAIEKRVNQKIAVAYKLNPQQEKVSMKKYYKMTSFDNKREEKVIQVVDDEVDPLEPPKFRSKRLHRAPPSPPVPQVHSPTSIKEGKKNRKLWDIPPALSNWKNPKGYTIPLDKRLAADGRGLERHEISGRFAEFSEALYSAEQVAREEIEKRTKYQEAILLKQSEKEEEDLRGLAEQARQERKLKQLKVEQPREVERRREPEREYESRRDRDRDRDRHFDDRRGRGRDRDRDRENDVDRRGRRERDEIRRKIADEVRYRRQDDRRRRVEDRGREDRDVSEQIALGLMPTGVKQGDEEIDIRLYESAGGGLGHGFREDSVYDRPLRSVSGDIYTVDETRMKDNVGDVNEYKKQLAKFESEKKPGERREEDEEEEHRRTGPVLFEREESVKVTGKKRKREEEKKEEEKSDPFSFLGLMSKAEKKGNNKNRGRGVMNVIGGGGSRDPDYLRNAKKRKIEFRKGK